MWREERSATWKCAVSGEKKHVAMREAVVFGMARMRGLGLVLDLYRDVKLWSLRTSGPVAESAAEAATGARNSAVSDCAMDSMAFGGRALRLVAEDAGRAC